MLAKLKRSRRGFTLIELLVVLVILALLAGIVLPRFLQRGEEAKVSAAQSQIAQFRTALETYSLDNGGPPSTQEGLQALLVAPNSAKNWKGPYLSNVTSIQLDPWGNAYDYKSPGDNGMDYSITSYGKDGKPGGTGLDADISSVQGGDQK